MIVESALQQFFSGPAPLGAGEPILVAFSGGSDSLALAYGLKQLADRGIGRPLLCHVDHQIDPDSRRRADRAREIADELELPFESAVCRLDRDERHKWGIEAAARRARYAALEATRTRARARWIATAHHRDDQVETTLLRLMFGSGLQGLAPMAPRRERLVRPLLNLHRSELENFASRSGIDPVQDPTNSDLRLPRNRIRHRLLPTLEASDPATRRRMLHLARTCGLLYASIERRVCSLVDIIQFDHHPAIRLSQLRALPDALLPGALSLLHRAAAIEYPPRGKAVRDLVRQLRAGNRIGCDCGDRWRWEQSGPYLTLRQVTPEPPCFAYTLQVPGECALPELSIRFRIRRGPVEAWMFRQSSFRAAFDLPLDAGDTVMVRNRRSGDRLRPFGCPYSRSLKDVLIDRRVPRDERSRLPLLFVNETLAWVPGVTIAEPFRLTTRSEAWIAELETT